jgi:quercetin dioxygenase-like cupin family protein
MSDSPVRRFVVAEEGFRWAEVELRRYKEAGAAAFRDVTRQTLFHRPDLRGELRYFEVAPSGHSTLERHGHTHAVMILRGRGDVLIGADVHSVGTFDLVTIPPATWHQFRASVDGPLGFLCMVDAERDRPELPDARELARLREDPAVAAFLDATSGR